MNVCWWKVSEPDWEIWSSDCGMEFCLNVGNPTGNGFRYCPKCGREIPDTSEEYWQEIVKICSG